MNKRSDGRRRKSKRRSKRSKRCRSLLGKKIGINIREGIYANKAQAIAVAYSQVRKRHPSCRRILGKKRRSKRRSIRRSKRKIMDGSEQIVGTENNGLLNDVQKQIFQNIFPDYTTIIHFTNIELTEFRPIRERRTQPTEGVDEIYNGNIEIKKHLHNSYQIVKINSQEPDRPTYFSIGRVKKYKLL
jgi:hypothetical protein